MRTTQRQYMEYILRDGVAGCSLLDLLELGIMIAPIVPEIVEETRTNVPFLFRWLCSSANTKHTRLVV